jgi:hypothetical protein
VIGRYRGSAACTRRGSRGVRRRAGTALPGVIVAPGMPLSMPIANYYLTPVPASLSRRPLSRDGGCAGTVRGRNVCMPSVGPHTTSPTDVTSLSLALLSDLPGSGSFRWNAVAGRLGGCATAY